MIRVIAIDDEPLALLKLVSFIEKIPFFQLIGQFKSAYEAKQFLNDEETDAVFCDINMPDLNGMDFVKSLAAPPIVVFTTAYAEYAVEGFKVDAVDYLLKPFGLDEFKRAAQKVKTAYDYRNAAPAQPAASFYADQNIFFKTDSRIVKINAADILYIEGMSEYVRIHLTEQKPITVLMSLKKIIDFIPSSFMRIHRSYIINLTHIREVNKNYIWLDDGTSLPIGEVFRNDFNAYISSKYIGK